MGGNFQSLQSHLVESSTIYFFAVENFHPMNYVISFLQFFIRRQTDKFIFILQLQAFKKTLKRKKQ